MSRYVSAFNFYNINQVYDENDFDHAINLHMADNDKYLVSTDKCSHCAKVVDSVAHDLGFDFKGYVKSKNKKEFLDEFLRRLEKEIDLCLISEYYDLSLVLLARRYCWTFDDITYLRSLESSSRPLVEESTKVKLIQFQHVDAAIYDFYNRTFWNLVNKEEGILKETERFIRHNAMMHDKCVAGKQVNVQHEEIHEQLKQQHSQ